MTSNGSTELDGGSAAAPKSPRPNLGTLVAVAWVGLVLAAGLFAFAMSGPGPTPLLTTGTFTTSGTTMTLNGDCTTDATIMIPDGFALDGAGYTITAIDPAGGHFLGAVVKNVGSTAHVRDLRITTSGLKDTCDGGDARLRGILFDGASGSIRDNTVTNINQGASGCQEGNGIEVRDAPFDDTHPDTEYVTIADNTVTGYQKTGIVGNGDVFVTITGNTVVGLGPVPYIAQNGIQIGFNGTGEVEDNDISGNHYSKCSNRDAAQTGCVPWVSAGLLLYDVDANSVKHSQNHFRDNQRNLLLITSASLGNP